MIDESGKNLVFLLSAPRAGSTMLGAMLGTHSRLHCPAEPWIQLLADPLDESLGVAENVFDHALAQTALRSFAEPVQQQAAARAYACSAYNAALAGAAKPVLVDKTPRYYHLLPRLAERWPSARFLWLQRSPLDVIASCKTTWNLPVAEMTGDPVTSHTFDVTLAFHRFIAFFRHPDPARRIIRYEELVADPAGQLSAVCSWLGVDFEPPMVEYGRNRGLVAHYAEATVGDRKTLDHARPHAHSIGRWREVLTGPEVATILRTLGSDCFLLQEYAAEYTSALAHAGLATQAVTRAGTWPDLERRGLTKSGSNSAAFRAQEETRRLQRELRTLDQDRTARGAVIESQGAQISALQQQCDRHLKELQALYLEADESRNQSNRLEAELADRLRQFERAEADRADRAAVIETQGREVTRLQQQIHEQLAELRQLHESVEAQRNELNLERARFADVTARFAAADVETLQATIARQLKELQSLYLAADAARNAHNLLQAQYDDLARQHQAAELDRENRRLVIEEQSRAFSTLQATVHTQLHQLEGLFLQADVARNEANLLRAQLANLETDRANRGRVIENQGREVAQLQGTIASQLRELEQLYLQIDAARNAHNLLTAQYADLSQNFRASEKDRADRLTVIHQLGGQLDQARRALHAAEQDRELWRTAAQSASGEGERLQRELAAVQAQATHTEVARRALEAERNALNQNLDTLRARWWFRLAARLGLR